MDRYMQSRILNVNNILTATLEWQNEDVLNRNVEARINQYDIKDNFSIWVYDAKLSTGCFVHTLDEIKNLDLKEIKKQQKREEYESLKKLYEDGD